MIGGKWKIEILFYIGPKDVSRFGQLHRCIGSILGSTPSKQLYELADDSFIERIGFGGVPPHMEYRLTERGRKFVPILEEMKAWGERELGL